MTFKLLEDPREERDGDNLNLGRFSPFPVCQRNLLWKRI